MLQFVFVLSLSLSTPVGQPPDDHPADHADRVSSPAAPTASATDGAPCMGDGHDPYACRPVCDSLFLASEWSLTFKQKACDLVQNRIFSSSGLAAAVWSAATSPTWDRVVGRAPDTSGFARRFATDFAQNAFKSTGAFVGGVIFKEDPRTAPPFLILRRQARPHGFVKRTLYALGTNFVAYRCDPSGRPATCASADDIKTVPALSRIAGSFASGFSTELWTSDRSDHSQALRGTASAYGATFVNSVLEEFRPELNSFIGKVFSTIAGGR